MADSDRRELTDELGIALRANNRALQSTIWTALPGFVVEFNPQKMTCKVQPTIQAQVLTATGVTKNVTLPLLVDCPVVFPSAGGFTLTFPIKPDDEVLVIFASRCIDSWWHSSGVQVQAELRMHDLSDGFVIPGPKSVPKAVFGISTSNVELRSDDGLTSIALTPAGDVQVEALNNVNVNCGGHAQVIAPTIRLIGNVNITGNLNVAGTFSTPTLPDYATHTHIGVRGGPDHSGPPFPGT